MTGPHLDMTAKKIKKQIEAFLRMNGYYYGNSGANWSNQKCDKCGKKFGNDCDLAVRKSMNAGWSMFCLKCVGYKGGS